MNTFHPLYVDNQGRNVKPLYGLHVFQQIGRAVHRNTAPEISIEDLIANATRAVARIRWRFTAEGQEVIAVRPPVSST